MKIVAGTTHHELAKNIAGFLNIEFVSSTVHKFEDSELRVNIKGDLKNQDVVIIQSTSHPTNDNLMELLLLIDSAKRAKAKCIVAVIPYFGYSRQDRVTDQCSSLGVSLVANLLEAAGVTKIITIDLHTIGVEKHFKIPIVNLGTSSLFISLIDVSRKPVIVSPDRGSILRGQKISEILKCDFAMISKSRTSLNECQMIGFKGNVKGRHCIIIDDIIDTAGTICKAADFLIQHGAYTVEAYVSHSVLSSGSTSLIESSNIEKIYITNTIVREQLPSKVKLISIDSFLSNILRNYFTG